MLHNFMIPVEQLSVYYIQTFNIYAQWTISNVIWKSVEIISVLERSIRFSKYTILSMIWQGSTINIQNTLTILLTFMSKHFSLLYYIIFLFFFINKMVKHKKKIMDLSQVNAWFRITTMKILQIIHICAKQCIYIYIYTYWCIHNLKFGR